MIEIIARNANQSPRRSSRTVLSRSAQETSHGSGVVNPRYVQPLDRGAYSRKPQAQTSSQSGKRPRKSEAPTIFTLFGCASAMCILGVIYLAGYAHVAKEEREIHTLQQNVSIAQARHQMLVQDLARLQSSQRIDTLASQMKMVRVQTSEYIGDSAPASTLADNPASLATPAQMASAQ